MGRRVREAFLVLGTSMEAHIDRRIFPLGHIPFFTRAMLPGDL
jgi:hypothetical protein